jgi:hypothetical protein
LEDWISAKMARSCVSIAAYCASRGLCIADCRTSLATRLHGRKDSTRKWSNRHAHLPAKLVRLGLLLPRRRLSRRRSPRNVAHEGRHDLDPATQVVDRFDHFGLRAGGGGGCAEHISVSDCVKNYPRIAGRLVTQAHRKISCAKVSVCAREDIERRQQARPRSVRESETHRIIRRALERYIRRRVDRLFMVDDGCALPSRNSSSARAMRKR